MVLEPYLFHARLGFPDPVWCQTGLFYASRAKNGWQLVILISKFSVFQLLMVTGAGGVRGRPVVCHVVRREGSGPGFDPVTTLLPSTVDYTVLDTVLLRKSVMHSSVL